VDHLYCLALLRRSSRKTPIHPESAVSLIKSWGKHLIELKSIIRVGKGKLKFFVSMYLPAKPGALGWEPLKAA